jgi:hypothetical protein
MKYLMVIGFLSFSNTALAMTECAARTSDDTLVKVKIVTSGPRGVAESGEVIFEKAGNRYGYRFQGDVISQFFEYDDLERNSAVVGLNAYYNLENPIQVKYVGPNFVDLDLKTVIADGSAPKGTGNVLRAWKGPGHSKTDQYQATQVACSVWANL